MTRNSRQSKAAKFLECGNVVEPFGVAEVRIVAAFGEASGEKLGGLPSGGGGHAPALGMDYVAGFVATGEKTEKANKEKTSV